MNKARQLSHSDPVLVKLQQMEALRVRLQRTMLLYGVRRDTLKRIAMSQVWQRAVRGG